MYANVNLSDKQIKLARETLDSKSYDHSEWFFGSKKIDRWFGYSFGYELCKEYSSKIGKKASKLVNVSALEVLNSSGIKLAS
jgi:uncharacterized protein YjaZ